MMYHLSTLGKAYSILFHDKSQTKIQSSGSPFVSKSAYFSVKSSPTSGQFNNTSAQFNNGPEPYLQKVTLMPRGKNLCANTIKSMGTLLRNVINYMGSQVTSSSSMEENLLLALRLTFVLQKVRTLMRMSTPNKHLLHNIQPLPFLYLVILPNGYKVKGSLHLCNDLIL